ncbi:MAG: IclR family transcriptional regulator, partial [Betaproteobacteria bacterium]|nr:IclR family transcriptional regulator [Betaproteobacteria bacterium]
IAAAIRDDGGRLVAGLSISAPADRANDGWLSALERTAREISAALGYEAEETAGSSSRA